MPISGQITVTASQVTAMSRMLAGIPYIKNSPVRELFGVVGDGIRCGTDEQQKRHARRNQ